MDWEVVASLAFLAALLWVAFKGGRSNPVSTGDLEQRVYVDIHKIKNKLQAFDARIANAATKSDIEGLRSEIADSASDRAEKTGRDLGVISEKVATVCQKVEGLEKTSDSTAAGVKRIEGYFLQKGIDGR